MGMLLLRAGLPTNLKKQREEARSRAVVFEVMLGALLVWKQGVCLYNVLIAVKLQMLRLQLSTQGHRLDNSSFMDYHLPIMQCHT